MTINKEFQKEIEDEIRAFFRNLQLISALKSENNDLKKIIKNNNRIICKLEKENNKKI